MSMNGPVGSNDQERAEFFKLVEHNVRSLFESDWTPREAAAHFRRSCLEGAP
jgi:hypothetical protein